MERPILPVVRFDLTSASPDFAKSVMTVQSFVEVNYSPEPIMAAIAVLEDEEPSFRVHPMLGNYVHFASFLRRTGRFRAAALEDPARCREIIMHYQAYLDPVIVTSIEHYLWTCDRTELQRLAALAGFPVGSALATLIRERGTISGEAIDKLSAIKAMLEVGGVVNCLPPTYGSMFLLSVRSPTGDSKWHTQLA